jgi:hypothetical protein
MFDSREPVQLRLELSVDRVFAKRRIRFDPCVDIATTVHLSRWSADEVYS